MATTTTNVTRGNWGELNESKTVQEGRAVIALAVKQGKLPAEFFERYSSKRASALNYDVYDRLGGEWLIQQRQTEIDKYGNHPTKFYYLVRRIGRGVEVTEVLNKAKANRASKTAQRLGDAIRCLRGERKLPAPPRSEPEISICFKAVAVVDGEYRSIYDNSTVYKLGKAKVQKAQENHNGGYYVYETAREAGNADVPYNSDNRLAPRVILRCECSGRNVRYDSGKIAFSRIKPLEVVE